MKKRVRSTSRILYMLSVGLFFLSMFAGELMTYLPPFSRISNILACLAFVLILGGSVFSLRERDYAYPWMYAVFFFVAALFWDLSYYKCTLDLVRNEQINAWVGIVSLNVSLLSWVVYCLQNRRKAGRPAIAWRQYIPLGVICAAFAVLSLLNLGVWFFVDSWTYYSHIAENAGMWNFRFTDMDPFMMGGHTCYAYSVLLMIGELLAPHLGFGQRAANCVLSIATIIAFYFITEKIWGKEKRLRSVLLTSIFAFGPLFYGISYIISSDFPLLCFFTLLLAAAFYDITFLKFIAILCVCFSKEVGVFILAGFYLGEVIVSFAKGEKKIGVFFRRLFDWKMLAIYSSAFLYVLILFFGSGGWVKNFRSIFSRPTGIEIPTNTYRWWHYPIFKIFEYFFMNFYWLIWVLMLIAAVTAVTHCRKEKKGLIRYLKEVLSPHMDQYVPIIVTYALFCVTGIAYFTYVHYRYVQLGQLFYVLSLGIVVDMIPKDTLKKELLLVPVVVLMTVESFITVDPVTYMFFKRFDAGNGDLITTRQYWYIMLDEETGAGYYWEADEPTMGQHYLADGLEYNREMIGLQRTMEDAFADIDYASDKLIVLDMFGGWESYTCAQLFGVMDETGWYWDPEAGTVVRYETDVPLNLAFDSDDLDPLMKKYSEVYYIDFPFNRYHENDVLKDHPAKDSFSESHLRWKIDVYRLK